MKTLDLWKLCLRNLAASGLRTCLTVLGMAIGIGAILAVLALGNAGQEQVTSELKRLGIDQIWLSAAEGSALCYGNGTYLSHMLGLNASEQIYLQSEVRSLHKSEMLSVVGCNADKIKQLCGQRVQGTMPTAMEWTLSRSKAVLGIEAARRLEAVPGELIEVGGQLFEVACIVHAGETFCRIDVTNAVFLPLEYLAERNNGVIHEVELSLFQGQNVEQTGERARRLLELTYDQSSIVTTMQLQMEAANSVVSTFVKVLLWIAMICVAVGGVGVMNILLVSIRERRGEIGIMKAMGVENQQICILFLLESIWYAACGGIFGIGLGMVITAVGGISIGLSATVGIGKCSAVWLIALATGIVFGVSPALRAAALQPADALRSD